MTDPGQPGNIWLLFDLTSKGVVFSFYMTAVQWVQIGGGRVMDEVEVDAELTARRKAQPGFVEASFPTIAGTQPHLSQCVDISCLGINNVVFWSIFVKKDWLPHHCRYAASSFTMCQHIFFVVKNPKVWPPPSLPKP